MTRGGVGPKCRRICKHGINTKGLLLKTGTDRVLTPTGNDKTRTGHKTGT